MHGNKPIKARRRIPPKTPPTIPPISAPGGGEEALVPLCPFPFPILLFSLIISLL
jgi:hypothetical protein